MHEDSKQPNGNGNGHSNGNGDGHAVPLRRFRRPAGAGSGWTGDRSEINIALVGLGYWGPNLLRVLADRPDVDVRWICDLDAGRGSSASTRRYPAVVGDDAASTTCSTTRRSTRS